MLWNMSIRLALDFWSMQSVIQKNDESVRGNMAHEVKVCPQGQAEAEALKQFCDLLPSSCCHVFRDSLFRQTY